MSSGTSFQANKVLDYLKSNNFVIGSGRWIKTGTLLVRAELHTEMDHKDFRSMMLRLEAAGVVEKHGQGSFMWKLIQNNWDRSNPFYKGSKAYEPIEPKKPNYAPTLTPKPEKPVDSTLDKAALAALAQGLLDAQQKITALEMIQKELKADLKIAQETAVSHVKRIEIKRYDGKVIKIKDKVLPKVYDRVLALAKCRRNILLVGPAGCGKTYLGKLIADSLGLDFGSISCTAGMSESHLLGRSTPNLTTGENVFNGAAFLDCFEGGGVHLLDEVDAADSNLMLCINTGLANGYLNVPNRRKKPRAVRHPDYVCIATANTFGRGANRQYAGRNQLDEATLDRFRIGIVEMDYDLGVELAVCPDIHGEEGRNWIAPANGDKGINVDRLINLGYNLRQTCQYVRHKINSTGVRRIMSTRFMEDAYIMCKEGGWDLKTVMEAFFEGWTPEEAAKVI